MTGFQARSSIVHITDTVRNRSENSAYIAFNSRFKLMCISQPNVLGWLSDPNETTGGLLMMCPERVRIWRFAIKSRSGAGKNITALNLSGSNDKMTWVPLITSTTVLEGSATVPYFFPVATNEVYLAYRFNVTASVGSTDVGIEYMQLFVYDR